MKLARAAKMWRVLRRLRFSQIRARLRLRSRSRRLVAQGLNSVLPRKRRLAADWSSRLARVSHGPHAASSRAPWQELLGRPFAANLDWLAGGGVPRGPHRRDLFHLETFYQDFLLDPALEHNTAASFLGRYLDAHVSRVSDQREEWHPYAVSNRAVNWLRWLAATGAGGDDALRGRIAQEILLLTDYVDWMQEWDIEANHLLKNLFAIAMVDTVLVAETPSLGASGKAYLKELRRQLLPDGAHFELCPMYHAKVVADLETFRPVVDFPRGEDPSADVGTRSRAWLASMHLTSSTWADFGDSWQIPELQNALFPSGCPVSNESGAVRMADSGFCTLTSTAGWRVVADVGGVGPSFNPGHNHSDLLSLIAAWKGSPVIVDPGVVLYSPNEERAFLKSCQAHNGPCLEDRDHTEMIGSFRIGRAARVTRVDSGNERTGGHLTASHDGYESVTLRREIEVAESRLRIRDAWEPAGSAGYRPWLRWLVPIPPKAVRRLHLSDSLLELDFALPESPGRVIELKLRPSAPARLWVGPSYWSPRFGTRLDALEVVCTTGSRQGALRVESEWAGS